MARDILSSCSMSVTCLLTPIGYPCTLSYLIHFTKPKVYATRALRLISNHHGTKPYSFLSNPITTSTTLRKPSISSSTVPPMPALAKLVELPTYTGFPVLRASTFESRVVKSSVPPCVKRGVLNVSDGEALCISLSHFHSCRYTHVMLQAKGDVRSA